MNKKGFTLVEIIVCVAIISVIGVVIGLNSDKMLKKEEVEPTPTKIETAAATYAEGNRRLVEDLYNEKANFIDLSVGELIDNGLIDESVLGESYKNSDGDNVPITRDTNIVVTLDAYGDLNFDFGAETDYGYLRADDIVIAAGDPYGCDYSIGEKELKSDGTENKGSKLMFIGADKKRIKAKGYDSECDIDDSKCMKNVTTEAEVVNDYQYWCNIDSKRNSENLLEPSTTYEITYIYKIEGLKSRKTRKVIVKEPLAINLKKENFNISTNNQDDFKLYDEGVDSEGIKNYKIYYNTNRTSNVYFTLNDIPTNYTEGGIQFAYKINTSSKRTLDNIIDDKIQLKKENPQKTHIIEVYPIYKKVNEYSESQIENDLITTHVTPSTKVKLQISDAPITIDKLVYTDPTGKSTNITGTSESVAATEGKKVTVNATSVLPITKIEYQLDNDTTWKTLNSNTLIKGTSEKIKIRVTNEVGQIKTATYNFKIFQTIANLQDSNCKTVAGQTGCYYKGNQTGNYVKYAEETWRIYKRNNGNMSLILDYSHEDVAYGQLGNCMESGCCNSGRYVFPYLGANFNVAYYYGGNESNIKDSDSRKAYQLLSINYQYTTMTHTIENFNNTTFTDTNLSSLMENFTIYPVPNDTKKYASTKIALLDESDYKIIAQCTNLTCGSNYLIKGAFWLLDYYSNDYGYEAYNKGKALSYIYNYSVMANGNISTEKGSVSKDGVTTVNTDLLGFRPVIQIKNSAKILSGNGTESTPYVIGN